MVTWFSFMAIMNSITLVIVVLYLISPACCFSQQQQPPSLSPRVSYKYWFCGSISFLINLFSLKLNWVLCKLCRDCYLRRKAGSARLRRAAITSATSATHAWRSRCLPCQLSPVWPVWRKLLRPSTQITSPWVGNAAAKIAFSTPRINFMRQILVLGNCKLSSIFIFYRLFL